MKNMVILLFYPPNVLSSAVVKVAPNLKGINKTDIFFQTKHATHNSLLLLFFYSSIQLKSIHLKNTKNMFLPIIRLLHDVT